MNYSKPELVLLADARVAIQRVDFAKDGGPAETMNNHTTSPAYEADE